MKPSDIFGNGKDKKPDKTLKDFVGRLQKAETKKNINKRKKEETELEVQRRFAKLRESRAKERHGPVRTGDNSFSYGDVEDEITDEEISQAKHEDERKPLENKRQKIKRELKEDE